MCIRKILGEGAVAGLPPRDHEDQNEVAVGGTGKARKAM